MSTINGVNTPFSTQPVAKAQATATDVKAAKSTTASDVSTNEFLKLLVTQLQNQDPLEPMDNSQFLTQLASFSSMEQLISINNGVTSLADAFGVDESGTDTE